MASNFAPVPNTGSQIERAVIAYLKVAFGADAALYQFNFSNDWAKRVAPLIDVLAHKSVETVPHTRNESYQVRIEAKWKGNSEAGAPNPDSNWVSINAFIGVIMAAMSSYSASSPVYEYVAQQITAAGRALAVDASAGADPAQVLTAANNADMAAFTCEYVEYKGAQRAEISDGSLFIKEVRNFEIRAANANVD